jgi:hypothetical protein
MTPSSIDRLKVFQTSDSLKGSVPLLPDKKLSVLYIQEKTFLVFTNF